MQHDVVVCLSLHTLLDHSSSVLQVRIMRMRSSSLKMGRGELVTDTCDHDAKLQRRRREDLGVWVRISDVEGGLSLPREGGGSREGLCSTILAGQHRPQRNPWSGEPLISPRIKLYFTYSLSQAEW